jgi:hypothetical protein
MTWVFNGRVRAQQVLPYAERLYSVEVTGHDVNDSYVSVPSWSRSASFGLEITTLERALWNIGVHPDRQLEDVTCASPSPLGDIAWMEYWSEKQHISVMFGCSNTTMSLIESHLNSALQAGHDVTFSFSGMFDRFGGNTLSPQPSVDEFEVGRPFPLDPDVRFWVHNAAKA